MRFRELKLRRDPNRTQISGLIDYQEFCGVPSAAEGAQPVHQGEPGFHRVDVLDAQARMKAGWRPFVLDVRKPHELAIVALPFMDMQREHERVVAGEFTGIPRDRPILVSCRSGVRSAAAAEALVAAGYGDVSNLEGGILDWARQIDPTMPTY